MRNVKRLAAMLVGTVVLSGVLMTVARAQAPPAALTGTVTSEADGAMEGVLVGAKKPGSTISTWVVSNAQGTFAFPRDRMEPGRYAISIRAVGYELPGTSINITAQHTQHDLTLTKIARATKLGMQLSNAEWLMSVPGTQAQKLALGGCVNCHTLQRVMFSRFNADEMAAVIQRMAQHTNNSSPMHPWMRPPEKHAHQSAATAGGMSTYFSSINLSGTDTFEFPLKTRPRPRGKAAQVIYTVYELPRPDASPHDAKFDAEGNVWYSDFNSQFLGKLDPRTGTTVEYAVPLRRSGQIAHGGLGVDIDRDGRIYFGNMSQMQVVRLDPKTGQMETYEHPMPESTYGDGHLTMVDPRFSHLDGKLWTNVPFDTGEANGTWQIDLATKKWTRVTYPPGSPLARAYDVVADSKNNIYGMQMTNDKLWITNGRTLETMWYDFPTKGAGCRRGHVDAQDRLWCGVFHGNRMAMFDPKTQTITEWTVPTPWTRPYDAQFDDKAYAWTAGMDADLAVRLNTATGEFTEYLLPHRTNVRHVEVQKSGALSSFWLGDQHGNTITRIEPLAP